MIFDDLKNFATLRKLEKPCGLEKQNKIPHYLYLDVENGVFILLTVERSQNLLIIGRIFQIKDTDLQIWRKRCNMKTFILKVVGPNV